jgi:hypothetical protein
VAMGGADAYKLVAEVLPKDIIIRPNMITSDWWDLDERYKNTLIIMFKGQTDKNIFKSFRQDANRIKLENCTHT